MESGARRGARIGVAGGAIAVAVATVLGLGALRSEPASEDPALVADLGGIQIGAPTPDEEPEAARLAARRLAPRPPAPDARGADVREAAPRPKAPTPMPEAQATIGEAIRDRAPQVQACYERELKKDADLGGTVSIAFTIEARGSVSGARIVKDGVRRRPLRSCIVKVVSAWRFAPPGEAVDVEYPFHLVPRG